MKCLIKNSTNFLERVSSCRLNVVRESKLEIIFDVLGKLRHIALEQQSLEYAVCMGRE